MQSLETRLGVEHHACTSYVHFNNGTIEVICKLVLNALRVMISELRWLKTDWPYLIPTIEYYLNHKPQSRLNNNAPIEVMTGLSRDDPMDLI